MKVSSAAVLSELRGRPLASLAIMLGISLMALNLSGLLLPLRSGTLQSDPGLLFGSNDLTLDSESFWSEFRAIPSDLGPEDKARSVTRLVNRGIGHYWMDAGVREHNLRVPAHENYLLYLLSLTGLDAFRKYEFTSARRALERGAGLCSQHSMVVAEVLNSIGIESHVARLGGHVVATAELPGSGREHWIVDADFGLVIPHTLAELESDPMLVARYYRSFPPANVRGVIGAYLPPNNAVATLPGAFGYSPSHFLLERVAYLLKWVIPVLLLLLGQSLRRGRTRTEHDAA